MKLSIIIPAYNEVSTIIAVIEAVAKAPLQKGIEREVIVIDDGSTDGTREKLKLLPLSPAKVFFHDKNQGKGAAVRTGIAHATGDFIVFQDADLEYDPQDYPKLLQPILDGHAEVVFGCRYTKENKTVYRWTYIGNTIISLFASILFLTWIRDVETCYKMFKADILKVMTLQSNGFEFEVEVTAKALKKHKIIEVPIVYHGRTYEEGKKITSLDGLKAVYYLLKYRFLA